MTKTKKITKSSGKAKKVQDTVVNADVSFYCCDGTRLYSLHELSVALENMNNDVFFYHVTSDKNDFYNWVKFVFKAEELANSMLVAESPKEMKKIMLKYI